jgi:hypothetical protein
MESYWRAQSDAPCETNGLLPSGLQDNGGKSIASEYDCLRLSRLLPDNEDNRWEAELCQYLKDFAHDVTKDTDIVLWWQVRK